MSVRTPVVAMNVLDGTQSVRTQLPPMPSASTTVTSAPCCAATSAASGPAVPPPMMMMRLVTGPPRPTSVRAGCDGPPGRRVAQPTYTVVDPAARRTAGRTSHTRRNDYSRARASLCRVRDEHASRTDEHPGPALAVRRDRVAAGLASDLLRGGPHLGGGGRHGRRGPLVPRVRGALRRPGGGRPRHGPLGGHRPHAGPQDPGPRGPP